MKSKLLGLFILFSLCSPFAMVGMELEGQDDTGDFLIEEMDGEYPEDTEYLAGMEEGDMPYGDYDDSDWYGYDEIEEGNMND